MTTLATSVPGPDPYLSTPGRATTPWPLWKTCFDNYLISVGGDSWSDKRKVATILSKAGLEAQRVYYATHTTDAVAPPAYTDVQDRLSTLFAPKVNPMVAIHVFRQRLQLPGEPISDFYAALRVLAPPCKFGTLEDKMLLSQIIEGTSLTRIRERLLMESDLTLEKGLETCRQIESAIRDAKTMTTGQSLHRTQIGPKQSRHSLQRYPDRLHQQTRYCFNCGKSHTNSYDKCPAKGKTCTFCGKINHFASVCLSKKQTPQRFPNKGPSPKRPQRNRNRQIRALDSEQDRSHSDTDTVQVLTLHTLSSLSKHIPCTPRLWDPTVGVRRNFTFIYDPGSPVTTIPKAWYHKHFIDAPLSQTPLKLKNYDKTDINVVGSIHLLAGFKSRSAESTIYIVDQSSGLLGLDLIEKLGISLDAPTLSLHQTIVSQSLTMDNLRQKYPVLFSPKLGLAKGFVHKIRLKPGVTPVQRRKKPVPLAMKQAVSDELKRLVEDGVLKQVEVSEWHHPMSVVKKPDGRIQITCDLRALNPHVIADQYPLPKIEELFSQIKNSAVFSKLDLAKAFFQVRLAPESRHLTAFQTDQGLYQYCRLPMGLVSSPSVYQKIGDTITAGLTNVIIYMDDIIVWGHNQESHNTNLLALLDRLQSYNMRAEPTKYSISKEEVQFLGHVISSKGIRPLDKNTSAITDAPPPKTYKALQAFLGSCSFNLSFLPNFSLLSEPLWTKLRGKEKSVAQLPSWTPADEKAFNSIKEMMCKPPVLGFFRSDCPTTVVTDASDYGLGATMYQKQDGVLRLIRCISHTLTDTERKYHIGEKEALACVWACERWHYYLFGRPFLLVTDHKALETLLQRSSDHGRKPARIARWYERLSRYNYTPVYRSGGINRTTDFLSRLPILGTAPVSDSDDIILASVSSTINLAKIAIETQKCPKLSQVLQFLTTKWPSKPTTELLPYFSIKDELSSWNGCVLRGEYRVVLPDDLVQDVLTIAHETHLGTTKMKRIIREAYWWPRMDKQITDFILNCEPCQISDKSSKVRDLPGEPITAPEAWNTLCIDIAGPFAIAPTTQRYIIVLSDVYSKWVEAAATSNITSQGIIDFLENVFTRFGFPSRIISDNGPQFTSYEFESYLQRNNIKHTLTALYNPQGNSPVERVNRWIKEGLKTASLANIPWKKALSMLLFTHRASTHSSTGFSPAELLLGRKIRTRLHIPELARPLLLNRPVVLPSHPISPQTIATFKVGDYARHKLPQVAKGLPSFSKPHQIISTKGRNTFELSNGTIWNARKLRHAPGPPQHPPYDLQPEIMPDFPADNPVLPEEEHGLLTPEPRPRSPPRERPIRNRRQHQVYQHFPNERTQRLHQGQNARFISTKGRCGDLGTTFYYRTK